MVISTPKAGLVRHHDWHNARFRVSSAQPIYHKAFRVHRGSVGRRKCPPPPRMGDMFWSVPDAGEGMVCFPTEGGVFPRRPTAPRDQGPIPALQLNRLAYPSAGQAPTSGLSRQADPRGCSPLDGGLILESSVRTGKTKASTRALSVKPICYYADFSRISNESKYLKIIW